MRCKNILLLLCLLPVLSPAQVILKGKTSSRVTAHIVRPETLQVTDDQGGWYEQGVIMTQPGAFNSPYTVSLPLRVTSSAGVFQVRLEDPLVLQHQLQPALRFGEARVTLGLTGENPQPLSQVNRVFHNPPAVSDAEESQGEFMLNISAAPPTGEFNTVTGTYTGVLSLTVEPVIE